MMQICTLLLLILITFSWLPASYSGNHYERFKNCQQQEYTCGNLTVNVSYPFRIDSRPDYCGQPGFYLVCTGEKLTVTVNNYIYRVLGMDYNNNYLHMVVDSFTGEGSCALPRASTSVDSSLYMYSEADAVLTIYYNCTGLKPSADVRRISCSEKGRNGSHSYYQFGGSNSMHVLGCSSTYLIAVDQNASSDIEAGDIGSALKQGFSLKWLAGSGWCRNCTLSGGLCGFNTNSTADQTCYCPYGTELGRCVQGKRNKKSKSVIIGMMVAIGGVLVVCMLIFLLLEHYGKLHMPAYNWKKTTTSTLAIEGFLKRYGSSTPKRYTYSDVKRMTKTFRDKLGQGGYGIVFKGELTDGRLVAVKVLKRSKSSSSEEFINEVASIGRTSHINIVCLVGFCLEGSRRALIYDFMPNGSLEKYIRRDKVEESHLTWETLYDIAVGVARGLEYLHTGCNTKIVHFDIKPHNILLDQNFCPKISDFGLAKLCTEKDSVLSIAEARGTIGYIAPEVFSRNFGVVTSKSDVYSYGMMILDMAGGRWNVGTTLENTSEVYFPHWIYEKLDRVGGLENSELTNEAEEIAKKMILVGLWCIQTMPANRPSINSVLEMLVGNIEDLKIPPKPYISSPAPPVISLSSESL